jgi:hypothetical protein
VKYRVKESKKGVIERETEIERDRGRGQKENGKEESEYEKGGKNMKEQKKEIEKKDN